MSDVEFFCSEGVYNESLRTLKLVNCIGKIKIFQFEIQAVTL
jgi:hypothetical protein